MIRRFVLLLKAGQPALFETHPGARATVSSDVQLGLFGHGPRQVQVRAHQRRDPSGVHLVAHHQRKAKAKREVDKVTYLNGLREIGVGNGTLRLHLCALRMVFDRLFELEITVGIEHAPRPVPRSPATRRPNGRGSTRLGGDPPEPASPAAGRRPRFGRGGADSNTP